MHNRQAGSFISASILLLGLSVPSPVFIPGALADTPAPVNSNQTAELGLATPTALASTPGSTQTSIQTATVTAPDPQAHLKAVFDDIEKLVKKYYPKATIIRTDATMHFELNCKKEMDFQDRLVLAPQLNGILCDLNLKPGEYKGKDKDRLPSIVEDGFHANLTMAPYSKQQDKYLLAKLSFPPNMDIAFKARFEAVVNSFNAEELKDEAATAKAASEEATALATAKAAAAKAAADQASKDAATNQEATFGAATMSVHRFPEGRFCVLFPDNVQTKNSDNQLGLAQVDYSAQGTQGSLNVSYMIMPPATVASYEDTKKVTLSSKSGQTAKTVSEQGTTAQGESYNYQKTVTKTDKNGQSSKTVATQGSTANDTSADPLFDKLQATLMQQINGVGAQQAYINLKTCPGRQIVVNAIKGKPDSGALVRIYLSGNYIYELSAVGATSWLQSPAVNRFMSSFDLFGGWGQWQDAQGLQHWQDADGWEHWRDRQGHEHFWSPDHHAH